MPSTSWELTSSAADRYEANLVPALMARWAPLLLDRTGLHPGSRVLDVGCGTGVVARTAAHRLDSPDHVTGVDINPEMLAVARRMAPHLDWRQGNAGSLSFADASFDLVTCQFALMFFPDQARALAEMARVLRSGGRAGVVTCGSITSAEPYARLAQIAAAAAGPDAAAIVQSPFVLSDPTRVAALFTAAGFKNVQSERFFAEVEYPTIDAFLEGEIDATPLGSYLSQRGPAVYDRVRTEAISMLESFQRSPGLQFPFEGIIVTGDKR